MGLYFKIIKIKTVYQISDLSYAMKGVKFRLINLTQSNKQFKRFMYPHTLV